MFYTSLGVGWGWGGDSNSALKIFQIFFSLGSRYRNLGKYIRFQHVNMQVHFDFAFSVANSCIYALGFLLLSGVSTHFFQQASCTVHGRAALMPHIHVLL